MNKTGRSQWGMMTTDIEDYLKQLVDGQLDIKLNPGNVAPRYEPDKVKQLQPHTAIITEQGMESGLPLVDIQMKDDQGNDYFFMISGRLINGLSAAIKGCNVRNHGVEEP